MRLIDGDLVVPLLQVNGTEIAFVVKFGVHHHRMPHPVAIRDGNIVQTL